MKCPMVSFYTPFFGKRKPVNLLRKNRNLALKHFNRIQVNHKGDVRRDYSQRQFLGQHSVAMLEQCCNRCRNRPVLYSVLFYFTLQVTSGYSISLIRDPARGTSQFYLRVAWTSAFKQFFLSTRTHKEITLFSYKKKTITKPSIVMTHPLREDGPVFWSYFVFPSRKKLFSVQKIWCKFQGLAL